MLYYYYFIHPIFQIISLVVFNPNVKGEKTWKAKFRLRKNSSGLKLGPSDWEVPMVCPLPKYYVPKRDLLFNFSRLEVMLFISNMLLHCMVCNMDCILDLEVNFWIFHEWVALDSMAAMAIVGLLLLIHQSVANLWLVVFLSLWTKLICTFLLQAYKFGNYYLVTLVHSCVQVPTNYGWVSLCPLFNKLLLLLNCRKVLLCAYPCLDFF